MMPEGIYISIAFMDSGEVASIDRISTRANRWDFDVT